MSTNVIAAAMSEHTIAITIARTHATSPGPNHLTPRDSTHGERDS